MDPITQQTTLAAAGGKKDPLYVDDVFSTDLWNGGESFSAPPLEVENGIDLTGEGGLVWIKNRSYSSGSNHHLYDTERGNNKILKSNLSNLEATAGADETLTFNTDGYDIPSGSGAVNGPFFGDYCGWTFRKAPGFFDVVTFSTGGTLSTSRAISHGLGSAPGFIIIKSTTTEQKWLCYHRSLGQSSYITLNLDQTQNTNNQWWTATPPTSTDFYLNETFLLNTNQSYVAYIFAHDDASFGTDGDESIIKCGSYTGNGSTAGPEINLGFEPQWLMIKNTSTGGTYSSWVIFDNMRGVATGGVSRALSANLSNDETTNPNNPDYNFLDFTSTGFKLTTLGTMVNDTNGDNYIYMAIRRPHKPPEAATDVFDDVAYTGTGTANTVSFSPAFADLIWIKNRIWLTGHHFLDRLRGNSKYVLSETNGAEGTLAAADSVAFDRQESFFISGSSGGQTNNGNAGYNSFVSWVFKRAPGFFDVVCYSGTGVSRTINHNLSAIPEMMIIKSRDQARYWQIYHSALGTGYYHPGFRTDPFYTTSSRWNTAPTSTVFTLETDTDVNASTENYVAYLFATLPGISKVGSYTGTGNAINVDCGFTAGARFVLIKRTDTEISGTTGTHWYVWDTSRGISSGNDPYLIANLYDADVTNTDYIDPLSTGFTVTSSAPAALNASGGTYIFLAIA